MKTAVLHNRSLEKEAFLRVLAPVVAQDHDDRLRQIIREELSASQAQQPHPPQQPSLKSKTKQASLLSLDLIGGFSDELRKIKVAQLTMNSVAPKPTVSSQITARMPRTSMAAKAPPYTQVNPASTPGPAQTHQPTLSPPPVRG